MKKLQEKINQLLAQITVLRVKLIIKYANAYLGVDASPLDRADDVVGCVESVTEVLKKAGAWPTIELGTYTFWQKLTRDKYWRPTMEPKAGDIVISPTGMGNGTIRGHVGIVGENGVIYSNDSYSGKWMANYTIKRWRDRYAGIGEMPVYYFTYISAL